MENAVGRSFWLDETEVLASSVVVLFLLADVFLVVVSRGLVVVGAIPVFEVMSLIVVLYGAVVLMVGTVFSL